MAKIPTTLEVSSAIKAVGQRKKTLALVITMAISAAGYEGTRLDVYDDGLGIPTQCMGQTQGVKFGQPARTLEECAETLVVRIEANQDVLQRRIGAIQSASGPITYKDLSLGEQEAYNSFYDNLGPGGKGVKDGLFALKANGQPSTLVRKLRAGDRVGACEQIMQWLNPKWMPGIKKRREAERAHCLRDLQA